jgi:hypothetical protein
MLGTRSGPTTVSVRTSPPSVSPTTPTEPRPPDQREPAVSPQRDMPTPARATPVVLALSLSPIHVRGSDEPPRLTIATGTDVVRLHLQGEAGDHSLQRGRAIVRTVAGQEVWRGRAAGVAGPQTSAVAHIDIPADRLRPDDYIVELLDANDSVREAERYRYFSECEANGKRTCPEEADFPHLTVITMRCLDRDVRRAPVFLGTLRPPRRLALPWPHSSRRSSRPQSRTPRTLYRREPLPERTEVNRSDGTRIARISIVNG